MHKDHTEISFRGQFKLEPHPHWSPLGVSFEFSDEHPHHFYVGVPLPPGSLREPNKGSKEREGPTLGVRFTEVSVLLRCPLRES